jgi:uncharacterized repeat protein (TIGR03803 family)
MGKLNVVAKSSAVFLLWAAAAVALPAQTVPVRPSAPVFTTLHNFDDTHGGLPSAGLVEGIDGNLYGTSAGGSSLSLCNPFGCGTVFKITQDGTFVVLHYFDGTDGYGLDASLIQATDGNFYGTTAQGGANNQGTAFEITASGVLTTLYNFCNLPDCSDGAGPEAIVQGSDGDFYGTTEGAGFTGGTVFKLTPNGVLTTLYSFCSESNCTDGLEPVGELIQGSDGNFYGTTYIGGADNGGTAFRLTPSGTLTILYSFCQQVKNQICTDGFGPLAGLVEGVNGSFYGTTSAGGANSNSGTVFKITPSGSLTTLHTFCSRFIHGRCVDGSDPAYSLILVTDGNFYGTTQKGGIHDRCDYECGTVFKITPGGAFTPVHDFCSYTYFPCPSGSNPNGLVQDTSGNLYGTTYLGGANGDGTIFSLSVGLGPFVETNPAAGKVGANVGILGTDLTGATDVTFNGTATAFRVVSSTFIEAKVPSGATTGTIQVQLPSGTLSSNVPFIVLR